MKADQQIITGCGAGDIAPYVFLCGDPARVPKITAGWEAVREVCRVREYVIQTGTVDGVALTAASTGIGGPSTAVVFEELANLGAHTFIRVGNSGALSDAVQLGDYVITSASIRDEGTTRSYVDLSYPAAAHYTVTAALAEAAAQTHHPHHVGVTWSLDAFYARNKVFDAQGQIRSMCHGGYTRSGMNDLVADFKQAGVLNVEMESATILTLASIYGLRAGCICTVSDRTPWPGPGQDAVSLDRNIHGAIEIAVQAMRTLAGRES
jgi:uridine phosphorylase